MIPKRIMFTKIKEQVIRVIQRSDMSEINWLDLGSTHQAGELGWIIMAQNLLSAIKVLDPDGQVQGDRYTHTHQAYWSLKHQKANDQANWI